MSKRRNRRSERRRSRRRSRRSRRSRRRTWRSSRSPSWAGSPGPSGPPCPALEMALKTKEGNVFAIKSGREKQHLRTKRTDLMHLFLYF